MGKNKEIIQSNNIDKKILIFKTLDERMKLISEKNPSMWSKLQNSDKFLSYLAQKLDCKKDEICLGNWGSHNEAPCPYKYVFGSVFAFDIRNNEEFGKLSICQSLNLNTNRHLLTIGDIRVTDSLSVVDSNLVELGKQRLERLYIDGARQIKSLKNVKVTNVLSAACSSIADLGDTKVIQVLDILGNKKLTTLKGVNVTNFLDATNTIIEDLGDTTALEELYISGNRKIKSLAGTKVSNLIYAYDTDLTDVGDNQDVLCEGKSSALTLN